MKQYQVRGYAFNGLKSVWEGEKYKNFRHAIAEMEALRELNKAMWFVVAIES